MVTNDKPIVKFQTFSPTTTSHNPEQYTDIRDLVNRQILALPHFTTSTLPRPANIETRRDELMLYDGEAGPLSRLYDHSALTAEFDDLAGYFEKLSAEPKVIETGGLINGDLVIYGHNLGDFYRTSDEQKKKFSDDEGRLTAEPLEVIERLYLEICTERSGYNLRDRIKLQEKKASLPVEARAQLAYFRAPSIEDVMNRAYRNVDNSISEFRSVVSTAWEKADRLPEKKFLTEMDKIEYALAEVLQRAYVGKKADDSKGNGKVINELVDKLSW